MVEKYIDRRVEPPRDFQTHEKCQVAFFMHKEFIVLMKRVHKIGIQRILPTF